MCESKNIGNTRQERWLIRLLTAPDTVPAPNAYRLMSKQIRKFLIRMQKGPWGINWKILSTYNRILLMSNSKKKKDKQASQPWLKLTSVSAREF